MSSITKKSSHLNKNTQFSTKHQVLKWLEKMKIENFFIHENLTVDVDGSVTISLKGLKNIPIQFGMVNGSFYCPHNALTSLKGMPHTVHGDFNCSHNSIKSLLGGPQKVMQSYDCSNNQLDSLTGAPGIIPHNFLCSYNALTTLMGCPQHIGLSFVCVKNKIQSLEYLPRSIGGNFVLCQGTKLNILESLYNKVSDLILTDFCEIIDTPFSNITKIMQSNATFNELNESLPHKTSYNKSVKI